MNNKKGEVTLEGKIVEVRDGQRKIRRSYTYGYRSVRIQVGFEYYSVLINTKKLNEYGFLPRVGQWIRVKGRLSQNKDDLYDPSISWITELKHIESPEKRISNQKILNTVTVRWQDISQISNKMDIDEERDKKILKKKLKHLTQNGSIEKITKRDNSYWRIKE